MDKGLPSQFFYAEVEFPTVEAAHAFTPPADIGLGEEKTESGDFSMSAYWHKTVSYTHLSLADGTGEDKRYPNAVSMISCEARRR